MGAGSSAAGSGVIVGICIVLLAQQLGILDLSSVLTGLIYLIVFAVVFGIFFGIIGSALGRRYLRQHSGLSEWKGTAASAAAAKAGAASGEEEPTQSN